MKTMSGGAPDRFVKQYEFLEIILEAPLLVPHTSPGQTAKDAWGITWTWPKASWAPCRCTVPTIPS